MAHFLQFLRYGGIACAGTFETFIGFKIVILNKDQAGNHSNLYVKIRKGEQDMAKYVFDKGWESVCHLTKPEKSALTRYLTENRSKILKAIGELK